MVQDLHGIDCGLAGGDEQAVASGLAGCQHIGNVRIDCVLEEPDGPEPLAVERQPLFCQAGIIQQGFKTLQQRRANAPGQVIGGGCGSAKSLQRVADAIGDPQLGVGQSAVQVEADCGLGQRSTPRIHRRP